MPSSVANNTDQKTTNKLQVDPLETYANNVRNPFIIIKFAADGAELPSKFVYDCEAEGIDLILDKNKVNFSNEADQVQNQNESNNNLNFQFHASEEQKHALTKMKEIFQS